VRARATQIYLWLDARSSSLTAKPAATANLPPYLVLLRVGFALPVQLLGRRCALAAPFHPYPRTPQSGQQRRYIFCGTFRQPALTPAARTLSGTLLCGVRTFLPYHLTRQERPSGPAAYIAIIFDEFRCRGTQNWHGELSGKVAAEKPQIAIPACRIELCKPPKKECP